MGPPLVRGGHTAPTGDPILEITLQWGHLSLEVVMPAGCLRDTPPRRLQWGHLSLEVVISIHCQARVLSLTRFGGYKRLVSERCPSRRFKHAANASTIPT